MILLADPEGVKVSTGQRTLDARRALYRERILDAAEAEFSRTGYDATKVQDVAAAAGLSLATVYKTFAGKAEIWDELHAARLASLVGEVEVADAGGTAVDRVVAGLEATARYLGTHEAFLDLSLRTRSGWAHSSEVASGVQQSVWTGGIAMIERALVAAHASGELRDIRPRIAAGLVVSSLQVWLEEWVESGRDRPIDEVVAELAAHVRATLAR